MRSIFTFPQTFFTKGSDLTGTHVDFFLYNGLKKTPRANEIDRPRTTAGDIKPITGSFFKVFRENGTEDAIIARKIPAVIIIISEKTIDKRTLGIDKAAIMV